MGPAPLLLVPFGAPGDPLALLASLPQAQYLHWYLADLAAETVLVEPHYFDRDYLSEFAAFYCTSTTGYPNVCKRAHYFAAVVDRELLQRAASGEEAALNLLQNYYLGAIVMRPIPATPLGRTVLRWYPDNDLPPRIVEPSREYLCNVAGIQLRVRGLAWQQQDAGVGACATVALWTMLHSSAFDDRHVVPTTTEVTRTAHRAGLSSDRLFPNNGLTFIQLIASVRDSNFAPLVVTGEKANSTFGRELFCSSVASFIRSGYPVLIGGQLGNQGGHAVCAVGFRQAAATYPAAGTVEFEDTNTEFLYVHDDNLGPAARFRVETDPHGSVILRAVPPPQRHALSLRDPTADYQTITPTSLLAAAHEDVRLSPDTLHALAIDMGTMFVAAIGNKIGLTVSSRILRLATYMGPELSRILAKQPPVLGKTRLLLTETVRPMSLHLGLVRFGLGDLPLLDVLYDTTDSVPNTQPFCYVAYAPIMVQLVHHVDQLGLTTGPVVMVEAFEDEPNPAGLLEEPPPASPGPVVS